MNVKIEDGKITIKIEGQELVIKDYEIEGMEIKEGKLKKISFKPKLQTTVPWYSIVYKYNDTYTTDPITIDLNTINN